MDTVDIAHKKQAILTYISEKQNFTCSYTQMQEDLEWGIPDIHELTLKLIDENLIKKLFGDTIQITEEGRYAQLFGYLVTQAKKAEEQQEKKNIERIENETKVNKHILTENAVKDYVSMKEQVKVTKDSLTVTRYYLYATIAGVLISGATLVWSICNSSKQNGETDKRIDQLEKRIDSLKSIR